MNIKSLKNALLICAILPTVANMQCSNSWYNWIGEHKKIILCSTIIALPLAALWYGQKIADHQPISELTDNAAALISSTLNAPLWHDCLNFFQQSTPNRSRFLHTVAYPTYGTSSYDNIAYQLELQQLIDSLNNMERLLTRRITLIAEKAPSNTVEELEHYQYQLNHLHNHLVGFSHALNQENPIDPTKIEPFFTL